MSKRVRSTDMPAYETLFFSRTAEFLNTYLTGQTGKSTYTRRSYKSNLSSFYDYVTIVRNIPVTSFRFSQCTYQFLLEYMQYMQTELNLKASTANSRLSAIRSYLEYASNCDASVISVFISARRVPLLIVPKVQMPLIEANEYSG